MTKKTNVDLTYYASVKDIANIDSFKNEFELWLNSNKEFLFLWENVFNSDEFEFEFDDYIMIDDWANFDTKSIFINPEDGDDYLIHPQVLMAFSIEDPIIKMNLVISIFDLPKKLLKSFLTTAFGLESSKKFE